MPNLCKKKHKQNVECRREKVNVIEMTSVGSKTDYQSMNAIYAISKLSIEFFVILILLSNSSKTPVTFIDSIGFNLCGQLIAL